MLKLIRHMTVLGVLILGMGSSASLPIVAVPAMASVADESLKTLRAREAEERQLDREAGFTGKVCGTSIRTRIDWSSTGDWPENVSIAKSCDGALSALEAICRGDSSRGSRINSFVCTGDGSGPSLSGGTLQYGATPGDNGFSSTKSYLEGEL